ncbi:MAG: methyltransferase domain-containing protein [Dehalococcoidia bacterium]
MADAQRSDLATRLNEFAAYYGRGKSRAERAVEREVFGADEGINSYTTPAQADLLAETLALRPGLRLLDIGAGFGWPGLYIARKTRCEAVLVDIPAGAIRSAAARAYRRRPLWRRCTFARASGLHLPFRSRSFDAVVHSDVL